MRSNPPTSVDLGGDGTEDDVLVAGVRALAHGVYRDEDTLARFLSEGWRCCWLRQSRCFPAVSSQRR